MSNFPQEPDPTQWHRYFAIEYNNRGWDLATRSQRSAQEDQDMLNAAHAAAAHWQVAGNQLNHLRAVTLLAEVHALLGLGSTALAYAEQIRDYFLTQDTPDWELALTHAIHAHAAHAAGDEALHKSSYQEAVQAIQAIADPEDRNIVKATFDQVAAPS